MVVLSISGLETISLLPSSPFRSLSIIKRLTTQTDRLSGCRPSHSKRNRPVVPRVFLSTSCPVSVRMPLDIHSPPPGHIRAILKQCLHNFWEFWIPTWSADSPNLPQYTFLLGLLLGIISSPALFFADIISASSPRVRPRLTLLWCA